MSTKNDQSVPVVDRTQFLQAGRKLARLRRHGSRRTKVMVRRCRKLPVLEALQAVRSATLDWTMFTRSFVVELSRLYPALAADIPDAVTEDTGPTLADYDVYGARADTGGRVNGLPIWRYLKNDVHLCEVAPGARTVFRWAPCTAMPAWRPDDETHRQPYDSTAKLSR